MMEDGRGTQFDADLLDLFLDAFDDVVAIRRSATSGGADRSFAVAMTHAAGRSR